MAQDQGFGVPAVTLVAAQHVVFAAAIRGEQFVSRLGKLQGFAEFMDLFTVGDQFAVFAGVLQAAAHGLDGGDRVALVLQVF